MRIGFIGAGRAGCSLGKYFSEHGDTVEVTGYFSLLEEDAIWAAQFTDSACYKNVDALIAASDSIILSTPDGAIKETWERLDRSRMRGKIVCHLSGSLSSDVFSECGEYGTFPISIHPMFAFSNKESVYQQLKDACFTLEGHAEAVMKWKDVFARLGNQTAEIRKDVKPMYHAAASVLSNHVVAVLQTGYEMLMQCGFSEEEARAFSSILVRENVEHVIKDGAVETLTGPIERADEQTVQKHLSVLTKEQKPLYRICGKKLVEIAQHKNADRDYRKIFELL